MPAAPTTVPMYQNYILSTFVRPQYPYRVHYVQLDGCGGTQYGADGNWVEKGSRTLNPPGQPGIPVSVGWTVVNQASGYYWWISSAESETDQGAIDDARGTEYGYYYTP